MSDPAPFNHADNAGSETKRRGRSGLRRLVLAFSLLLCGFASFCYAVRPDGCAAFTVWPVWWWAGVGLTPLVLMLWRKPRRAPILIAALWFVYLFAFAEEATSLLRSRPLGSSQWQEERNAGRAVRVVSLNCAGGSPEAAREVGRFHPDIVLLQESPPRRQMEQVGREIFGTKAGVVPGIDASILVRGRIEPRELSWRDKMAFTQARAILESGVEIEVISLRLIPPLFREDLWNPDCWRQHADNRHARREQVGALTRLVGDVPGGVPLLVGGDFNAPQGDAMFRLLRPRLHDTFPEGGVGWGNTIINEFPALRIDQIWASRHFHASAVRAVRTLYSDHRMVVCDLYFSPDR